MHIKAALIRGLALVSLAAWLATVPFIAAPSGRLPSTAQFATAQRQTVLVRTDEGQGSAVVLERDGVYIAWTAAHVVGDQPAVSVVVIHRENGKIAGETVFDADVLGVAKEEDVALLRVHAPHGTFSGAKFADASPLLPGTPIYHVGNFFGSAFGGSISVGVVAQVGVEPGDRFEGWPWKVADQMSGTAFPGSSGGPVFDYSGRIVGLLVGGVSPSLSVFVPVRVIEKWAKENGFEWAVRGNSKPTALD
jgi:S1-C subfamily serine protease